MRIGSPIRPQRVLTIARREFCATARRREFILITLGLPVLYIMLFGIVFSSTIAAVTSDEKRQAKQSPPLIGFFDGSKQLDAQSLTKTEGDFAGRNFASESAGLDAVRSGKVRSFVSVSSDFLDSGDVTVYTIPPRAALDFGDNEDLRTAYVRLLRMAALTPHVSPKMVKLALLPVESKTLALDAKTGKFVAPDPLRDIARLAIPYAVSMLLLLSVLLASSYLLHGIVEEKESRVIEILVSAVTHEELLLGKLIGLGGVGLLQLAIWLSSATIATIALKPASLNISASPELIACAVAMFVLGYTLYASIMAGIGSLGTSWKESQQIASACSLFLIIPLLFLPTLLEDSDCLTARVLSFVPLTSPVAMLIRVAAGGGSALEVAISIAILIVSICAIVRLSARLFRMASLLHGQRPNLPVIWRAMISRSR